MTSRTTSRTTGRTTGRRQQNDTPRAPEKSAAATVSAGEVLKLPRTIVVRELADRLDVTPIDVVKELLKLGIVANINQTLDFETASQIATNLGFEAIERADEGRSGETTSAKRFLTEDESILRTRPPVVTIMGHVDHGKTSLLDAIRETNVTEREAGGITQHIGAYQVEIDNQKLTFLDTPGHEAFTAMRARGARATDIAIIVVAADDGIMPQTIEAIDHARAADVPLIVALNKIDKPEADVERVKRQLAEQNLLIEEWGGDTICISVSAKTREGIPDLLEHILLVAEVEEFKADPNRRAEGVIVEAQLDQQRGPAATVLVQTGTLRLGEIIVAENTYGRIKAMYDDRGRQLKRAEPSMPAKVLGFSAVPSAGVVFTVASDERTARALVEDRQRAGQGQEERHTGPVTLERFQESLQAGQAKELNVVLKADVQGSIEPIRASLLKLGDENARVRVLRAATGNVTESDVLLALASSGIILGFNTRPEPGARRLADSEGVEIRAYDVIYHLTDDIEKALKGMLEPTYADVIDGHAEVRQVFNFGRRGIIAGCNVTDGKVTRTSSARVMRKGNAVHEGKIESLKRFKDDVREVTVGFDCGISVEGFTDFQEGDIIEGYHQERSS